MNKNDLLSAFSMPVCSPSFPKGPYTFFNREYLIVVYESDPAAIRHALPEPLEPDGSNRVLYEFIKMPDSTGFGDYQESGIVIPARFQGEDINFTAQMYLDCHPPIAAGREIWGFPKKDAKPSLKVVQDTLTGSLTYADQTVAMATMAYKHTNLASSDEQKAAFEKTMQKKQVNLKLIPHVSGTKYDVAQLIVYRLENIHLQFAYSGPARLHLIPHVNAPVADLPVKKIVHGLHYQADVVLPMGEVLHNYL